MKYTEKKFLLGSGSPRRKLLFEQLGMNFRIVVSHADEIYAQNLAAGNIAQFLAEEKSKTLLPKLRDDEILITADTIVWFNDTFLGKPLTEKEAFEMISQMNGRKHEVYSGVCIQNAKNKKTIVVKSEVYFRKISDEEIIHYIKEFKPFDKAGSYGAQDCLPEDYNPCSTEEKIFLKNIGMENLYVDTSTVHSKRIPLIERIKGSYFNVMGLPIVELVNEIENF